MEFGDDWPGVFIRGDNCMGYALSLREILRGAGGPIERIAVNSLLDLLLSAIASPVLPPKP